MGLLVWVLTINITGEVDMNIIQVQDALKNASDMQLSGELQNPTGLAPSYLVLSEVKRRQQMRQGAMTSPAPQSSMAEEAASQAQPEYYPEEQPQEEESGIEAFREGGVVRMAEGGAAEFDPLSGLGDPVREERRPWFGVDPLRRLQEFTDQTRRTQRARERGDIPVPFQPDYNVPGEAAREPFSEYRPAAPTSGPSGARVAPTETPGGLYGPPAPPPSTGAAAPRTGVSEPRGGGMPSGAAQPSGQTTDPTIQALYDRLRATGQSREDYRKDAVNTGLMQAGLAMMASKDPNALANLGQGGLRGLESYTQEMRQGRAGERQGIQDEITIRRAQTEEAYRRGIITNQERQLRMSELRLGQEAGNRAETRESNNAIRLEQINQRNVQSLVSSLTSSASRINRIETELGNMGTSPERRDVLNRELAGLQRNDASIRRRLAQIGGAEYTEDAPTQGSSVPPPGAPIVQFRAPGGR